MCAASATAASFSADVGALGDVAVPAGTYDSLDLTNVTAGSVDACPAPPAAITVLGTTAIHGGITGGASVSLCVATRALTVGAVNGSSTLTVANTTAESVSVGAVAGPSTTIVVSNTTVAGVTSRGLGIAAVTDGASVTVSDSSIDMRALRPVTPEDGGVAVAALSHSGSFVLHRTAVTTGLGVAVRVGDITTAVVPPDATAAAALRIEECDLSLAADQAVLDVLSVSSVAVASLTVSNATLRSSGATSTARLLVLSWVRVRDELRLHGNTLVSGPPTLRSPYVAAVVLINTQAPGDVVVTANRIESESASLARGFVATAATSCRGVDFSRNAVSVRGPTAVCAEWKEAWDVTGATYGFRMVGNTLTARTTAAEAQVLGLNATRTTPAVTPGDPGWAPAGRTGPDSWSAAAAVTFANNTVVSVGESYIVPLRFVVACTAGVPSPLALTGNTITTTTSALVVHVTGSGGIVSVARNSFGRAPGAPPVTSAVATGMAELNAALVSHVVVVDNTFAGQARYAMLFQALRAAHTTWFARNTAHISGCSSIVSLSADALPATSGEPVMVVQDASLVGDNSAWPAAVGTGFHMVGPALRPTAVRIDRCRIVLSGGNAAYAVFAFWAGLDLEVTATTMVTSGPGPAGIVCGHSLPITGLGSLALLDSTVDATSVSSVRAVAIEAALNHIAVRNTTMTLVTTGPVVAVFAVICIPSAGVDLPPVENASIVLQSNTVVTSNLSPITGDCVRMFYLLLATNITVSGNVVDMAALCHFATIANATDTVTVEDNTFLSSGVAVGSSVLSVYPSVWSRPRTVLFQRNNVTATAVSAAASVQALQLLVPSVSLAVDGNVFACTYAVGFVLDTLFPALFSVSVSRNRFDGVAFGLFRAVRFLPGGSGLSAIGNDVTCTAPFGEACFGAFAGESSSGHQAVFTGNTINLTAGHADSAKLRAALHVLPGVHSDALVVNNTIAVAAAAPVVGVLVDTAVGEAAGAGPVLLDALTVANNTVSVRSNTTAMGMQLNVSFTGNGSTPIAISDNTVTASSDHESAAFGLRLLGAPRRIDTVLVRNTLSCSGTALTLPGSHSGSVVISSNVVRGALIGATAETLISDSSVVLSGNALFNVTLAIQLATPLSRAAIHVVNNSATLRYRSAGPAAVHLALVPGAAWRHSSVIVENCTASVVATGPVFTFMVLPLGVAAAAVPALVTNCTVVVRFNTLEALSADVVAATAPAAWNNVSFLVAFALPTQLTITSNVAHIVNGGYLLGLGWSFAGPALATSVDVEANTAYHIGTALMPKSAQYSVAVHVPLGAWPSPSAIAAVRCNRVDGRPLTVADVNMPNTTGGLSVAPCTATLSVTRSVSQSWRPSLPPCRFSAVAALARSLPVQAEDLREASVAVSLVLVSNSTAFAAQWSSAVDESFTASVSLAAGDGSVPYDAANVRVEAPAGDNTTRPVVTLRLLSDPSLIAPDPMDVTVSFSRLAFACGGPSFPPDTHRSVVVRIEPHVPAAVRAAAAATVGAGTAAAVASVAGSATALGDVQSIGIVARMECAGGSSKGGAGKLDALLAPIQLGGGAAGSVGGSLLLLAAAMFLQGTVGGALFVVQARVRHVQDYAWRDAAAVVRAPGITWTLWVLLLPGVAFNSFWALTRGDFHPVSLFGAALALASPAVAWWAGQRFGAPSFFDDTDTLVFCKYCAVAATLPSKATLFGRFLRALIPLGRWGPPNTVNRVGSFVKAYRPVWVAFAAEGPLQAVTIGLIASLPAQARMWCGMQHLLLVAVAVLFAVVAGVTRPHRIPAASKLRVVSMGVVAAATVALLWAALASADGKSPGDAAVIATLVVTLAQGTLSVFTALHTLTLRVCERLCWSDDGKTHLWLDGQSVPFTEESALDAAMINLVPKAPPTPQRRVDSGTEPP